MPVLPTPDVRRQLSRWSPPATGAAPVTVLPPKLAPPSLGHPRVLRPRLLTQLSRAVGHSPITLVSGPAGAGKTVLAASWAEAADRPVAWVTLDDADDDPATFWTYVQAALTAAGVDLSGLPLPAAGEQVPIAAVSRLGARVLAHPRPVVLVLDNADHLTAAPVLEGLDLLVRHAGLRLRLVLCARADPPLPFHQYQVAGIASEIRAHELAFTSAEAEELLTALGAPVGPRVVEELCEQTEGWAVGLRLAAAPLKRGTDPADLLASLARDDGSVARYLVEEVLKAQPAGVRRFLLRVSVTEELEPELVEELAGRAGGWRTLAGLARSNSFVEQSGAGPGRYRIHPLFRQMLQAQLAYEMPGEVAPLHRRCAAWYVRAGRIRAAVAHAEAAGDWTLATCLLVDDLLVARLLAHGSEVELRRLAGLPPDLPGPDAAVVRAAAALCDGRVAAAADLAAAERARDGDERPLLRVSAAVVLVVGRAAAGAGSAQVQDDAAAAERLLRLVPEPQAAARRELGAVLAVARCAAALRSDAPDEELMSAARTAVAASRRGASGRLRASAQGALALLDAVAGDLTRADELAAESLAAAPGGVPSVLDQSAAAATARAWVAVQRYELEEGRRWAARADAAPVTPGAVPVRPLVAVLHSRLLRLRHDFERAGDGLEEHVEDPGLPRWIRAQVVLELERLLGARGGSGSAARLAELSGTHWADLLAPPVPSPDGDPDDADCPLAVTVGTGIARSGQLADRGGVAQAVDTLRTALQQASPEQMRWPFLDAPVQVRHLLRTHPQLRADGAWLAPGRPRGAGRAGHPADAEPVAVQPTAELSEREREVLRLLAEMMSTTEIAATLFVSVNTVRTHVRNILRKLSVSRRNQAVRRARELGLI